MEKTKENIEIFKITNGEETTKHYLKIEVFLLADIFAKFIKTPIGEFDNQPLYYVNLPGYTWQCGKKYTDIKLQTLQDIVFFC